MRHGKVKRKSESTAPPTDEVFLASLSVNSYRQLFDMIFFASILVAGLASTSWARPAAQTANNGASSPETAPADCAIFNSAFPTLASDNCCTVSFNQCNNGRLTQLSVSSNNLNGPIPDLSQLTNLQIMNLSLNAFTGSIPDMFGSMTNLVNVSLNNNQLTGSIPNLSKLINLTFIDLSDNNLNGSIPDMFGSMTNLGHVSLNNNKLTGSLPPSLLKSSGLNALYLEDNSGLTGQFGDTQSTNLPSLTNFNFNGTQLTVVDPLKIKLEDPSLNIIMANGANAPPAVPQGGGNDPWVTWLDPEGNWHNQQVNDPTTLLNGNYVVTAIGGVNICSGNWAFLYQVPSPAEYPTCQGNFGAYNTANNQNGMVDYSNLKYGTCPQTVYASGTQTYSNCWTGYYNWKTPNTGNGGISVFPNGMRTGYCCFN